MSATAATGAPAADTRAAAWLFGRRTDLLAFGGSAAVALGLLGVGQLTGWQQTETPIALWLLLVVGIDVAHVWTSLFRVYLDGPEFRRRRVLYTTVPVLTYAGLLALHAVSAALFWRVLAYTAVFHFVRQQAGWWALYRGRAPHAHAFDAHLERTTLYAAMLYPLLYWHAHLPTGFYWFIEGDFAALVPTALVDALTLPYYGLLLIYVARQLTLLARGQMHWGRVLLVSSTWSCWHLGIVTFGSDYAFTVTNVVPHGVPYAVLVYRYARARAPIAPRSLASRLLAMGGWTFGALCLGLALTEEALWDALVWRQFDSLWPATPSVSASTLTFIVPMLALPQATHYILDGIVWRRRHNPQVPNALQ